MLLKLINNHYSIVKKFKVEISGQTWYHFGVSTIYDYFSDDVFSDVVAIQERQTDVVSFCVDTSTIYDYFSGDTFSVILIHERIFSVMTFCLMMIGVTDCWVYE